MRLGWLSRYRDLLLPLLVAPLVWWLFDATPIDRWLIGRYYDTASRAFPLRDDLFMQTVMHSGLKLVVLAIGAAAFGAWLLSWPVPDLARQRRRLLWLFAGMTGATLLVSTVKHYSAVHCPWDLAEYGGYAPFHALLERVPSDVAPGRCFPSGHASGGFALFAFYFAFRGSNTALARSGLAAGMALGIVMGWAQMMRGAHFLSHTVWSAWTEWTFLAVLALVFPPEREIFLQPGCI